MQTQVDAARLRIVGNDFDLLDQAPNAIDQLAVGILASLDLTGAAAAGLPPVLAA